MSRLLALCLVAVCATACSTKSNVEAQKNDTATEASKAEELDPPASKVTAPSMPVPPLNAQIVYGMLTFLEGIPKDWHEDKVTLTMGAQCSSLPGCVAPECSKVLVVCATVTIDKCGEFLSLGCPQFEGGDDVSKAATTFIRGRYTALIDAAISLSSTTDEDRERLDSQRKRFGL